VLAGQPLTFELGPQGSSTGKPKETYSNVYFNKRDLTVKQDAITGEKLEGEATTLTLGTYP
jgi:hypothetical protein